MGGRIYVFQSGLGAVGEGKLANRENAKLYVLPCRMFVLRTVMGGATLRFSINQSRRGVVALSHNRYGTPDQEQIMFLPDTLRMDRFYSELAARAAATQVRA